MIRFIDILIELVLGFVFFLSSVLIMEETDYPFLIIGLLALYVIVHYTLKRRKRITKYVRTEFEKLGYNIISERPLKSNETKIDFSIEPAINDIPISRYYYIRQFARVFKVKNKDNEVFELNSISRKNWNGKIDIIIKNKKKVE